MKNSPRIAPSITPVASPRSAEKPASFVSGFVAIVGRPNAGKSTLLNQLVESEISIVSMKAQTTRERVLGILTEPQRGQMIFIDTPGIHRAREGGINEWMVDEAKQALDGPSAIWYLLDPTSELKHEEVVLDLLVAAGAAKAKTPVLLLLNKSDLIRSEFVESKAEALTHIIRSELESRGIRVEQAVRLSALENRGIERLVSATWALLPEGPMYYPDADQLSDRPVRFFVAEKIREQVLRYLGDELPYSCAVVIDKFIETGAGPRKPAPGAKTPAMPRIEATLFVERESQKPMVIGQGGKKIKEIGQHARESVEKFMGQKVFLGLRVAVKKNWTKDPAALREFGYKSGSTNGGGR